METPANTNLDEGLVVTELLGEMLDVHVSNFVELDDTLGPVPGGVANEQQQNDWNATEAPSDKNHDKDSNRVDSEPGNPSKNVPANSAPAPDLEADIEVAGDAAMDVDSGVKLAEEQAGKDFTIDYGEGGAVQAAADDDDDDVLLEGSGDDNDDGDDDDDDDGNSRRDRDQESKSAAEKENNKQQLNGANLEASLPQIGGVGQENHDNNNNTNDDDDDDNSPEWVVEKILDKKIDSKGFAKYLVKWEGFKSSENTWEPIEYLAECDGKMRAYEIERAEKIALETRDQTGLTVTKNPQGGGKALAKHKRFEVGDIMGVARAKSEKFFLISLANSTQKAFIRTSLANVLFPEKVIDFYVKNLRWRPTVESQQ